MNLFDWLIVTLLGTILEAKKPSGLDEEDYEDICPFPWQTHEQNILSQYAQCNEFENEGQLYNFIYLYEDGRACTYLSLKSTTSVRNDENDLYKRIVEK